MTHEFFHSLVETDNIAGSLWAPARSSLVLSSGSFPLVGFLSCMLWLVHNYFQSSLCVQISPFICLPGLSSLSPLAQGLCRALLLPSWQPADSLKVVSRTVITSHLCHIFQRSLSFIAWYPVSHKLLLHIFFLVYLVVLGGRIYLVPVTPSGLKPK